MDEKLDVLDRGDIMSKTFFWIACLYSEYQDDACGLYYYDK